MYSFPCSGYRRCCFVVGGGVVNNKPIKQASKQTNKPNKNKQASKQGHLFVCMAECVEEKKKLSSQRGRAGEEESVSMCMCVYVEGVCVCDIPKQPDQSHREHSLVPTCCLEAFPYFVLCVLDAGKHGAGATQSGACIPGFSSSFGLFYHHPVDQHHTVCC